MTSSNNYRELYEQLNAQIRSEPERVDCLKAFRQAKKRGGYEQTWECRQRWRLRRLGACGKCEICCKTFQEGEPQHVHHRTYKNYGDEEWDDLVICCESCHIKEARIAPANTRWAGLDSDKTPTDVVPL